MSMWLNLAKVSPDLLAEIRERPDLLDTLFFDDGVDPPAGFDLRADVFGCDYRTLTAIAQGMAAQEAPGSDWRDTYVFLRRATGEEERDHLADYEFTYGPAFAIGVDDVLTVHRGLSAEGWDFDEDDEDADEDDDVLLSFDDDDDDDEDDEEEDDGEDDENDADADELAPEYDDVDELVPFFAAAAREGKAIVGGVG
jgi:hypothetical protein